MSAGEMSDGTPVSPELDARMLAELREWRRLAPTSVDGNRWSARLTIDELDMLLRVAAERDALKAALCSEWEADIPAEIRARAVQPEAMPVRAGSTALGIPYAHPMREPGLLPFCDCGSVDKYGDDLGEHGPRCPYHLAVLEHVAAKTPTEVLDALCKRTLEAQARLA